MKRCAKCRKEKPLMDFHRQPSGPKGRHSYCKACYAAKYKGRKRKDDPTVKRDRNFRNRYGLTAKQVAERSSCCEICQSIKRLCVDHDHVSGKVRGTLCHVCNIALPAIENASFRERAIAYLEKYR